jgi:hypothetical protein
MASKGQLVDWSGQLDCRCLVRSTCKTTKVLVLTFFSGLFSFFTVEVNCFTRIQVLKYLIYLDY